MQRKERLEEAVEFYITNNKELNESMEIYSLAMKIRKELLEYKDKWSFSGDLTTGYQKPSLLSFLLQTMLFGKHAAASSRSPDINKVVEDVGRVILFNTAADW